MKLLVITIGHGAADDRIYHKEIRSFLDHGHQVTLVTRNSTDDVPPSANFIHHPLPASSLRRFTRSAFELAKSIRPDSVIIHEFELLPLGKKIKTRLGSCLVYDVHDPHRETWAEFSSRTGIVKTLINGFLDKYERHFLPSVDMVWTTTRRLVWRYQRFGVSNSVLIPNYPRLTKPVTDKPEAPVKLIYHGQLSPERGLEDLIMAVASLKVSRDFHLYLIGHERIPGFRSHCRDLAENQGVADKITVAAQKPYEEIISLVASANIGIIPFRDRPMFQIILPIKLFEFWLLNCAVVSSDLLPVREVADDNILYFIPGDVGGLSNQLSRLISDASLRQEIAARGRSLVENSCNWGQVEPQLLESLESLAP